jgi:hypothetical protein
MRLESAATFFIECEAPHHLAIGERRRPSRVRNRVTNCAIAGRGFYASTLLQMQMRPFSQTVAMMREL